VVIVSHMNVLDSNDEARRRHEAVAGLPALFSLARQVVMITFAPGDPEADALRAQLDECVVSAHRLALRERTRLCGRPGASPGK
jgi:hypothetical protein